MSAFSQNEFNVDPLVSIVIPCYNDGKYLATLFRCLRLQTFQDFEVIVVNDGSVEQDTIDVLESLPPNVRLINKTNNGLPSARNTGIAAARGRYFLPLDCDDTIERQFLEKAVTILDGSADGVGFVFTDMRLEGSRQGVLVRGCHPFDQLFLNRLPYCMLIRKSAWVRAGGYDETMRDGYEDWEFSLRLMRERYVGHRIPEALFVYNVRREGMHTSKSCWKHTRLWKDIRRRHVESFSWRNMLRAYNQDINDSRAVSIFKAGLLLAGSKILPHGVAGAVVGGLLRYRMSFDDVQTLSRK